MSIRRSKIPEIDRLMKYVCRKIMLSAFKNTKKFNNRISKLRVCRNFALQQLHIYICLRIKFHSATVYFLDFLRFFRVWTPLTNLLRTFMQIRLISSYRDDVGVRVCSIIYIEILHSIGWKYVNSGALIKSDKLLV